MVDAVDAVCNEYKKLRDAWLNCNDEASRRDFLFNGALLDIGELEMSKDLVKRVAALKDFMKWRQDNDAALLVFEDYGKLPVANCAVYDLADRDVTKETALKFCIQRIIDHVNPLDVYMWNPLGLAENAMDGYKWYAGQKLIVYQLRKKELELIDLDVALCSSTINGYNLMDPLRAVKKVFIVLDDWNAKDTYLRFNLGIDSDDVGKLFDDAWNGLKHEWSIDGRLIENYERLHGYPKSIDDVKPFKRDKKHRKPRIPKDLLKRQKKSNIVYLIDRKGTKSAYFDPKILFPDATGPVF